MTEAFPCISNNILFDFAFAWILSTIIMIFGLFIISWWLDKRVVAQTWWNFDGKMEESRLKMVVNKEFLPKKDLEKLGLVVFLYFFVIFGS